MMKWLCQLLLALDYLQTMKVLHRDIKTSNLLLTCDMDVQLGMAVERQATSSICCNVRNTCLCILSISCLVSCIELAPATVRRNSRSAHCVCMLCR
jgi:serine/threonine protein kinase